MKNIKMMITTGSLISPESLKIAKDIKAVDDAYKLISTKYNDLWALGIIFLELVIL